VNLLRRALEAVQSCQNFSDAILQFVIPTSLEQW